jgi:hypothetical protein
MEWKRCKSCGNLKAIDNFWKKHGEPRDYCIECERKKVDKEKKKEYDRNRYSKTKKRKPKEKIVCFRCGTNIANVKNNQLYWCFDCLKKYEEEYKQKIKVEIIDSHRRKI